MRFYKTPWLIKQYFRGMEWSQPNSEKILYLTFDDGPIPIVTEYVLDLLKDYQAKASFFCVGDNIRKHPRVYERILAEGHQVGNHTFNHLNGWKTDDQTYLQNIQECQDMMNSFRSNMEGEKSLFRPPYGMIKSSQWKQVKKNYRAIMWDVLTYDFDKKVAKEICLHKALKYSVSGSIVLFHDSIKSEENLRFALPAYVEHFSKLGYSFASL